MKKKFTDDRVFTELFPVPYQNKGDGLVLVDAKQVLDAFSEAKNKSFNEGKEYGINLAFELNKLNELIKR